MKVLIVGASGMIGQGVLRAALAAPDVEEIYLLGRSASSLAGAVDQLKMPAVNVRTVIVPTPFLQLENHLPLAQVDACFFCLGQSAAGLTQEEYHAVTYDVTLNVATQLAAANPQAGMVYVSGAGADSSEQGRVMWARVRGKTENALLALPLRWVTIFRPGVIRPMDGITSRTAAYRWFYRLSAPLLPLAEKLWPAHVLSTRRIGAAMLNAARGQTPLGVLESEGVHRLAQGQLR